MVLVLHAIAPGLGFEQAGSLSQNVRAFKAMGSKPV
jgi:hypothetical protein